MKNHTVNPRPRSHLLPWLLAAWTALFALMGIARAEIIPPGCKFNGIYIYLGVDKQLAHVGDTLAYSLIVGNAPFPGCRAEQLTGSITTPDGVVHPITLNRTILNPGESDEYINVVTYVVRQQDIRSNGIVVGSANLTAVINQNVVNENATSFKDVNTIIVNPAIAIQATCQGGVGEFGAITFSGTVRNTGDVLLTDVSVTNTTTGLRVIGPINLAVGQQAAFEGSFVPSSPCNGTAGLTAYGIDKLEFEAPLFTPKAVTASTSVTCANTTTPQIKIVKECPAEPPLAGTALTYRGTVQNLGNVTLTNIVVVSDRPAANTTVFTLQTLAPGESATFTANYPTPADACSTTDTLTASGRDRCTGQTVSNATTTTCPLATGGAIDLVVNCPANPPSVGGTITYSGTVSNPGTVTLTNVVVVNDAAPATPVFTVANLAPGASANFTSSTSVSAQGCTVSAAFTATASNRCGVAGLSDKVSLTCPVNTAPAILVTHECPATAPAPGETATLTGTVSNTGNVALTSVTVVNGGVTIFGPVTLAPGASAPFTTSFTAPADSCSVSTSVTASGLDQCSERAVSNTSTKTCQVRTTPALVLSKFCPETPVASGASLTYTGVLRNTGNVTLTDVVVTSGNTRFFGPVTLAPGIETNLMRTVTAPSGVCTVTDAWTATGKDKCTGTAVTQTASTTCPILTAPAITLTVACPSGQLTPGGTAKLTGTVRNTGNVTLTDIVVINEADAEAPVFTVASLAPNASASYTANVAVPNNICTYTANLRARGADQCSGALVSTTAAATCTVASAPQIAVTQECPAEPGMAGLPSTITGRVSNTGNITLNDVTVTRTVFGATTTVFGPVSLEPGQSAGFTASATVPANVSGCTYTSALTAQGRNKCTSAVVTAQNSVTCSLDFIPAIEVQFRCPPTAVAAGRTATYSGVVRNVGNVQLNSVKVVNSLTGDRVIFSRSSLAVGQSVEFSGTYTVPHDCCTVTSTLKATATDNCGQQSVADTSTGTCPILFAPKIAITRECPTDPVEPGDTLVFTGELSNPGDIALTDVVVSHVVGEMPTTILGPIVLAPGQTVHYRASFRVPPDYCADSVTAVGQPSCPNSAPVSAEVTTKCNVITTPLIMVVKECPDTAVAPGDMFTFTGTVRNLGNVTLTDVVVVNNRPTNNTVVLGPITLAPGASSEFTASYQLAANCCETLDVLTATGKDRCSGQEVENTAAAICPVRWSPLITITKYCTGGDSFWGSVQNLGNIVLTNVVVMSHVGEGAQVLLGPIELAQNEFATFGGSAPPETLVSVTATSLCHELNLIAYADCEGTVDARTFRVSGVAAALSGFTLTWESLPGQRYRVEYKDGLADPQWEPLGAEVTATSMVTSQADAHPSAHGRMYRVLLVE